MQELADLVWNNPRYHSVANALDLASISQSVPGASSKWPALKDAAKAARVAAILASSSNSDHRESAFRTATQVFELFGNTEFPFDQALRVVLTRLGNFPSISTRSQVSEAIAQLPWKLAAEEFQSSDAHSVRIGDRELILTDYQRTLWDSLIANQDVAVSAPTSAGKSFVLQNYILDRFSADGDFRVVYLVPTRALIAQVADDLSELFQKDAERTPQVVTLPPDPDDPLPARAAYVLTQERTQLALSSHAEFAANLVVVDEAQSIGDGGRGVLLQWVIDDLIGRNPACQVLFASPIIRNLEIFERIFELGTFKSLPTDEPTVGQNFIVVNVKFAARGEVSLTTAPTTGKPATTIGDVVIGSTLANRKDKLVQIPAALGKGQSNIVYANGAAEAEAVALQLADLHQDREPSAEQQALSELAAEAVHPQFALCECAKRGVTFHYSNIPTNLRRAVEKAAASGSLDFLVCTSTLLQGVNLPAKNIFMFAPEKGKGNPLKSTDFWNLSGRAGRLRREFHGNIYLIDYHKWDYRPLDGERAQDIVPAIHDTILTQREELLDVIKDDQFAASARDDPDLETSFGRLLADRANGTLSGTLRKAGLDSGGPDFRTFVDAIDDAHRRVTLPDVVLKNTPSISAHKQQKLYDFLRDVIEQKDSESIRNLIPYHPRESDAFTSYATILALCHKILQGRDTSKNLHRFHALLSLKWMQGIPLPRIIDDQIRRAPAKDVRSTIRNVLEQIETQVRFQTVRLFGCYISILSFALSEAGMTDRIKSIPSIVLYLEVGASDKTMISFISLGLSRVSAMKLNELSARKDMTPEEAITWLRRRPLDQLGLSPFLLDEVRAIVS